MPCIKLFYQISMLFLFGISYLLLLIISWQTLPNHWKNIEIFIWEWIIPLPGAVSEILNIINHLAVIYYTTITVSISRLLDELNANLLICRFQLIWYNWYLTLGRFRSDMENGLHKNNVLFYICINNDWIHTLFPIGHNASVIYGHTNSLHIDFFHTRNFQIAMSLLMFIPFFDCIRMLKYRPKCPWPPNHQCINAMIEWDKKMELKLLPFGKHDLITVFIYIFSARMYKIFPNSINCLI